MPLMTMVMVHMFLGLSLPKRDNGYSMQGINPVAKIMPVKVLDSSGVGDMEKIALGIKYAVDHGAKGHKP